jgi:hypothetical protein
LLKLLSSLNHMPPFSFEYPSFFQLIQWILVSFFSYEPTKTFVSLNLSL